MLMLNVPATVGLIVLAHPIVRVIFERGRSRRQIRRRHGRRAAVLRRRLLGYSVVRIASPTFYALGDSRTPVQVSVASVVRQRGAEHRARALLGYPRARARHVDRGAVQCCRPAVAAARAARWAGRPARRQFVRQDRDGFARDGNGGARPSTACSSRGCRATHSYDRRSRLALTIVFRPSGARASPRMCCRIREFRDAVTVVAEARRFQGIDVARRRVVGTDWINAVPISLPHRRSPIRSDPAR